MANIQSKGKITGQLNAVPQPWNPPATGGSGPSPFIPPGSVNSIVDTWRDAYVTQLNAGIVYGTNTAPPNNRAAFAPYLGGPTTGPQDSPATPLWPNIGPSFVSIGNNEDQNGQGLPSQWPPVAGQNLQLTRAFLTATQRWNSIRRVNWRVRISPTNAIIWQTTQPSFLISSYAINISQPTSAPVSGNPVMADLTAGSLVPLAADSPGHPVSSTPRPLLDYMQDLVDSTFNNVRNATVTIETTVCHQSCHSSCHGSRSRR